MTVRVTSAAQSAAIDAKAIASGTPSWTLMSAAGERATEIIRDRFPAELARGVTVVAGPGNNGGDGYVIASRLAAAGVRVNLVGVGEPRSDDAKRARAEVPESVKHGGTGTTGLVVDALLGTGPTNPPHGDVAKAIAAIGELAEAGARAVAVDVPSGVDATTGATPGSFVTADLTITFGTVKRGLLRNRDAAGRIVCVDIGLGDSATEGNAPELVDGARALRIVPRIPADAHKGTRRRLLVVGGSTGLAGAAILAARGALRSGVGMVKLCVEPASIAPVQAAAPAALTAAWPAEDSVLREYFAWAHAVLVGPGLGLSRSARELAELTLSLWRGPIVADADALTSFAGHADRLGDLLKGRPAIITPHAVEAQRLAGMSAADIDAGRFDAADRLADRVHATVILKGVPTIVSDGRRTAVVSTGTPVLATGGSGDLLGGIVATLLAQTGDAFASAIAGAWVHGRAAELAGGGRIRGVTLDDVVEAMRDAWVEPPRTSAPVIAELPSAREAA